MRILNLLPSSVNFSEPIKLACAYVSARLNNSNGVLSCFIVGCTATLIQAQLFSLTWLIGVTVVLGLLHMPYPKMRFLLAILIGLLSTTVRFQAQIDNGLESNWERKDISLVAQVVGLPKQQGRDISFRAEVLSQYQSSDLNGLIGQRLQLSCYRCPLSIRAGEVWRFTVRLKRPHGYASPGAFDYEKFLFRHRLIAKGYLRLKSENYRETAAKPNVNGWRLGIKQRIQISIGESITDTEVASPGVSTISALAVGDKSGFSQTQRRVLQDSGLSHLFAISGLHIGLIFAAVLLLSKGFWSCFPSLFERYPRPHLCLLPAILSAGLYAALAGFSVSTQRAMVMLVVFVVCRLLVREISLLKVLLIAATCLLIYDPFSVLDTGFWLSCGAVLVIYVVSLREQNPSLVTLQPALWLGMMPLTALFFGQISLLSPLLNLVAVPLFCLVLIPATLLAVLLNELGIVVLSAPALTLLGWCYDMLFSLLERAVSSPVAKIDVPGFSLWQWGIFILLMLAYRWRKWWLHVLWPVLLVLFALPALGHPKSEYLKLTLLDVGQGLAMVIQTESAVTVYDTGPKYSSGFTAAQAVLLPYLRSEGIRKVDRLIISHADNDHIGGYQTLLDAMPVKQLLTSRVDKLPMATECWAGQEWQEGVTRFKVLSPHVNTPKGSNNRSCVIHIQHNGTSVLITGDIEKQVERFLMNLGTNLSADIMLVPHQGSKTSSTAGFIDAVKPKLALVAAGYLNHYGHPHPSVNKRYSERNIDVLSTIDSGTIEIIIEKNSFQSQRFRERQRRFWHWR